ncbi:hypothetical protein ACP70R_047015 [Stipagrostis hirtigluma subsp. patula]
MGKALWYPMASRGGEVFKILVKKGLDRRVRSKSL